MCNGIAKGASTGTWASGTFEGITGGASTGTWMNGVSKAT